MDEQPRPVRRAIRTIGRLAPVREDDIVVDQCTAEQQWHIGLDRDLAIAQEWKPDKANSVGRHSQIDSVAALETAVRHYERHQSTVLTRTLDALDDAVAGDANPRATFDPPEIPLETLLSTITSFEQSGELPTAGASAMHIKCIALGEFVARTAALIELLRNRHITSAELQRIYAGVLGEIEQANVLKSAGVRGGRLRDTITW